MLMVGLKDLVNIIGAMGAILRVFLKRGQEMGREFGKRDLGVVINIRDSILMIGSLGLVFLHGLVEIHTKEIMKMTLEMGLGKCIGQMEASIKVNGKTEFSMEWDKYMSQAKE